MNTLLLFFAFPIAIIILAIVLQKILKCPLLVAGTFFAILLILTYTVFGSDFLVFAIIYTLLAYVTALLTNIIHQIIRRINGGCDSRNCSNMCNNNCLENLIELISGRCGFRTNNQTNLANQVNCLANQVSQTNTQLAANNQTARLTQGVQANLANQVNCLANQVNQLAEATNPCTTVRERPCDVCAGQANARNDVCSNQSNNNCTCNQEERNNRTRVTFTSDGPNPVIFLNGRGDNCRRNCSRCGRR